MDKKGIYSLIGLSLILVLSIEQVLAYDPSYYMNSIIDMAKDNFGPFFGAMLGSDNFGPDLFSQIIVFFLLFAIIFIVLDKTSMFHMNRGALFVVTLAVSLLGTRGLISSNLLKGLLLPYTALGAAILVFIPLLVYSAFVEMNIKSSMGRRLAWATYAIVFLILIISRWNEPEMIDAVKWIYIAGIGYIIICLFFDKKIQEYLDLASFSRSRAKIDERQIALLLEEYNRYKELYAKTKEPRWDRAARETFKTIKKMGYRGSLG
jgi:hypothetical protein